MSYSLYNSVCKKTSGGGRVSWRKYADQGNYDHFIAFDSFNSSTGLWEVHLMDPSDWETNPIDVSELGFPGHVGNPSWHPTGSYMVVQAQKDIDAEGLEDMGPGYGLYNDLYILTPSGSHKWLIQSVADYSEEDYNAGARPGCLHACWNPAGTKLAWAELYENTDTLNHSKLAIADFGWSGNPPVPSLGTVSYYELDPGQGIGPTLIEPHSWYVDGENEYILCSIATDPDDVDTLEVYRFNLSTKAFTRLSDNALWDEHARKFPLESGYMRLIVYASHATSEYYDHNGNKLTDFNPDDDYWYIVSDYSWNADGDTCIAYVLRTLNESPYTTVHQLWEIEFSVS